MFDRLLRSPSTIIVLLIAISCCACMIFGLILSWPEPLAKGDVAAALLKKSDSPLFQDTTRVTSQDCYRFLKLAEDLMGSVSDCYQVQLASPDHRLQYLNAAWVFDSVKDAEEAASSAAEPPIQGDGVVQDVPEMPQIGLYSAVTTATISTLNGQVYMQNIFWTHKNILVRLTVISWEQLRIENLYNLAVLVEGRMPE
jgi:hypothetical protein